MGIKTWLAKVLFRDLFVTEDAGGTSSSGRDPAASAVKRVGIRMGDVTSKDFEDPEFDLVQVQNGYLADSYIRQGVDKYVDQIFKEGFEFFGNNDNTVEFINQRMSFIAEATKIPTELFFQEIADDVVKYGNCFTVKVRSNDPNTLPPGLSLQGIGGGDPVAGYFNLNATTIKMKRDKTGVVTGYQQETDDSDKPVKFKPEDIVHFHYKREKGNAFGTPFLWPVLDDVRALRQAEENVMRMMYRHIHPFHHIRVGSDEFPCEEGEVEEIQGMVDDMEVDGGLITSHRVEIKPVVADRVIDAEPYLRYMEERVFSGMGIPAILFGRGDTANRSTGDSMTSEMSDRIKAIQKLIEANINEFIMKELLLEGGFDPIISPDDMVWFRFKENDLDSMVKFENHVIYKYEHMAINEDEMRELLSMEPISDRALMYNEIKLEAETRYAIELEMAKASAAGGTTGGAAKTASPTKAANNKNKPTNQHGTKSSPKKTSDSFDDIFDLIDSIT